MAQDFAWFCVDQALLRDRTYGLAAIAGGAFFTPDDNGANLETSEKETGPATSSALRF